MYEILERLLRKNGMTPYGLSKETGVPQSTLSDWKTGKTVPKMDKIKKIADYFGVTTDYLMGNTDLPTEDGDGLRFALYGEPAEDVTDAELDDVRRYAEFIRERKRKGDA